MPPSLPRLGTLRPFARSQIAVLTDDVALCPLYESESQNVRDKGMCCNRTVYENDGVCRQQEGVRVSRNNQEPGADSYGDCIADNDNAGIWVEHGRWNTWAPLCERAPFSRDNHLGNSVPKQAESGSLAAISRGPSFEWEVPGDVLWEKGWQEATCVLRMRYNISTTDYDGWGLTTGTMVDSKLNGADAYPKNNPTGDFVGVTAPKEVATNYPLQMNINTNQYGRTFEDRSHTFKIKRRPNSGPCAGLARIHNLNVRGRRGNIVQTYPAVEYDFVPNRLEVNEGDCVHFQWTGSDANPAGNAGNGRRMTDRSNIVEISSLGNNVPVRHGYDTDAAADTLVSSDSNSYTRTGWTYYSMFNNDEALVKRFMYLDQEQKRGNVTETGEVRTTGEPTNACDDEENNEQALDNCKQLNAASGYFDGGLVQMGHMWYHPWGRTFYYMSSRNNDFTNRSQKATIVLKAWKLALVLGCAALAMALCCLRAACVRRRLVDDPEHRLHSSARGRCIIRIGAQMDRWYHKSWFHKAPWSLSAVIMAIGFYWLGYWHAIWPKQADPAPFYPHAKGCGRVLDITCNLIFLPVLRNLISWLRTTPLRKVLPLGEEIFFHKLLALLIAVPAAGHILFHYLDYEWHARLGTGITVPEQAFGSWTGISGHLILLCMAMVMMTAVDKVRRGRFKTKWFGTFSGHSLFVRVHKLWIVILILLWSHSKAFWHYSLFPTVLLIVDKLIGRMRGKEPVQLVEAAMPARDVMALKLQLFSGRRLRYQAGQYLFLHCPQVSATEWHPFTISSSPEERHFGVHIRCRKDMDWTFALRQLLIPDPKNPTSNPPKIVRKAVQGEAGGGGEAAEEGGGWLSWLGGGGGQEGAEAEPLKSGARKLKSGRTAKNVKVSSGLTKGSSKSWKEGDAGEKEKPETARRGFLRRHLTKSIPKPQKIPPPGRPGAAQGQQGADVTPPASPPDFADAPSDEEWEGEDEEEAEEEEAEADKLEEEEQQEEEQQEEDEQEEDAGGEAAAAAAGPAAEGCALSGEAFDLSALPEVDLSGLSRFYPDTSPPASPPESPPPSRLNPAGKARLAPGDMPAGSVAMEIGGKAVELYVDGPYGSASEDVFGFEVMILVGAGIGVTPFASILKTLAIQLKQDRLETPLKQVAFYWVCRDETEFESFRGLLVDIVNDHALRQIFSINTYITGELDLKKFAQKGDFTGYHQFAGKPAWSRIGKELRAAHPEKDIGVFLCGPNAIGDQLVAMCEANNPKPDALGRRPTRAEAGPRFVFHKETF